MADPTIGTKPTPAELAGLEHAFAVDSQSDAYRPLTEAYLALGRYMEAMVVGKAGAKAHPDSPLPRVLLAKIYQAQGRHKKSLDELNAALGIGPEDLPTLIFGAELRLQANDREGGEELLKKAAALAPADEALLRIAGEHGVDLTPPKPVVEDPPPEAQAPVEVAAPVSAVPDDGATPVAGTQSVAPVGIPPGYGAAMGSTPMLQRAGPVAEVPVPAGEPAPRNGGSNSRNPVPIGQTRRPAAVVASPGTGRARLDPSSWATDDDDERPTAAKSKTQMVALMLTALLVVGGLGGWYSFTKWSERRTIEISKLLDQTNDQIRKDTYASYKAAAASAERILELDGSNYVAHAYLAFINALRWGEQGEGDDFKRRAIEQLAKAKKAGQDHGRIVAAEAYIQFFNGEPKAAEATISAVLETGLRSGLLYTTLGTIQMWGGELDKASATLKQAQALEPNSVRVLSELGQLHRRRGMDAEAWTFYDSALRIDGDHADSLVGKALLVLDANEVDRPKADKDKLLLEAEAQIDKVLHLPDGAISARQLALAKFARAQLLFARDQRDSAERLEQEAFTLDPGNPDIRLMRGRRLLREKNVDGAVAEMREAIRIDDKRAIFYVDLSRALLAKAGGAKEAVGALETAIKSFPDSGRLYVLLGDTSRAVPDVDGARKAYERAIEVEGGKMPEARAKLGAIWREKREFAKATEELEKALKELGLVASGPNLALAYTELGRVFDERPDRDVQQAFDRYAKAMSASESYAPPYFFLGRISAAHRDREQQRQAIESLETYVRLAPTGPHADEARNLLARLR